MLLSVNAIITIKKHGELGRIFHGILNKIPIKIEYITFETLRKYKIQEFEFYVSLIILVFFFWS